MKLSKETKKKIYQEFEDFKESVKNNPAGEYGEGKRRDELGQFFTPVELAVKMIEKFDDTEGPIMDPCAGSGNLLAAAILTGFDPKQTYANEFDPEVCENILRPRLNKLGVPNKNIHVGDALNSDCLKIWDDGYEFKNGVVTVSGKKKFKFGQKTYLK